MIVLLKIVYNFLFIPFLNLFLYLNNKFKKLNRNNSIINLYKNIYNTNNEKKRIWFHASSMGEFEQAKPVIELIKEKYPEHLIICTFFSPSGYDNQRNYEFADLTSYIPVDSKSKAKEFVEQVKPDIAVFVRYDLWLNFLNELKLDKTHILLINATIPGAYFKSFYSIIKSYYSYSYSFFDDIFCFNQESLNYFEAINIGSKLHLSSDTRLDRIAKTVSNAKKSYSLINQIKKENYIYLVAGSSWEYDENLIIRVIEKINVKNEILKVIFVPHKPTNENVSRLHSQIKNSILFSKIENMNKDDINTLDFSHIIVDKMGLLLKLYSIADIAYVGCGFGDGVHSTAEPAGYGIPIISGPNIHKSPDAVELNQKGGLLIIHNDEELLEIIKILIGDKQFYKDVSYQSYEYINKNIGSSNQIVHKIEELINGFE